MKTSLLAAALVLCTTACAAQAEDDAEASNDAISTPRDGAKSKVERLRNALDVADVPDFGKDFGSKAKPYIEDVLAYVRASFDSKAEAYSFRIPSDKDGDKFYIVDIRGAGTNTSLFYVYRATFEGSWWTTEVAPTPFARCDDQDKVLKCFAVSSSQRIYEPPAKATSSK